MENQVNNTQEQITNNNEPTNLPNQNGFLKSLLIIYLLLTTLNLFFVGVCRSNSLEYSVWKSLFVKPEGYLYDPFTEKYFLIGRIISVTIYLFLMILTIYFKKSKQISNSLAKNIFVWGTLALLVNIFYCALRYYFASLS